MIMSTYKHATPSSASFNSVFALFNRLSASSNSQSQVIFVSWRTRIGHGGKNSVISLSMLLTGDGVLLLIMMIGTTTKMVICGHRG
jgi:hypothetical protein